MNLDTDDEDRPSARSGNRVLGVRHLLRKKSSGLGVRFKEEVDRFLARIAEEPILARLRKNRYRRVNLSVFKHYIAYIVVADEIWVVAICHSHMMPEFWLSRLPLAGD